jgi:esterase/lipase
MKLTGGSLKVNELMELLKASYLEQPPKTIYGFTLDEKLSNLYGKVYVNMNKKKVAVIFRGTGKENYGLDWANNLIYASSSAYKQTERYKTAKKMYDNALQKYKGFQVESIGHSQGSLVAMFASKNTAKYISLAGAGATIDKILVQQISKNNPTLGEAAKQQFDTLRMNGKIEVINPFLISLFAKPMQSFWSAWMLLNPLKEIKKLTIPVLIIQGNKDLQVNIENAEALHAANLKSELVIIKNMNHVLKDIQKDEDNLSSYYKSTFPISEKLIETIVSFVNK